MAKIAVQGTALLAHEDGEWVMYGVQPGGISDTGSTPQETHASFRQSFKEVLFDLVEEARDLDDLRRLVERFAYQVNGEQQTEWEAARTAVRAGAQPDDPFAAGLPQERGDVKCSVLVERIEEKKTTPAGNLLDEYKQAA